MRTIRTWLILVILFSHGSVQAQTKPTLFGPGVFLRGFQQAKSVQYTASVIKPSDSQAMRNISVEITLPSDAVLTNMFVSRQIEYKALRISRSGAVTLIWQISRISSGSPLDTFSFATQQPLTKDLEFYMKWQSEDGKQFVENFTELPPLIDTTQVEGKFTISSGTYTPLNGMGVSAALVGQSTPLDVTIRVLPVAFNPPAKFGAIWWCSLLEITGVPVGSAVDVLVPLRRPVAPFSTLQLFQRSDKQDWTPLDGRAIVTADGQHVMYRHPGGTVATGGSPEIQPEVAPADTIPVETPAEPAEPPQNPPQPDSSANSGNTDNSSANPQNPAPTTANITDGSSNTVVIGDATPANTENTDTASNSQNPQPTEVRAAQPTSIKGAGGVISVNVATAAPVTVPTAGPAPTTANVTDGSSNTVIVSDATAASAPPTDVKKSGGSITINVGTTAPLATPTRNTQPTTANITDGSSNTIIIGEITATPASPLATPTRNTQPTTANITDGSSNTIIIGEITATPASPLATPTRNTQPTAANITDGSSNTIIIGGITATPTSAKSGNGGIIIANAGTAAPTRTPTAGSTSPAGTPTGGNQPPQLATTVGNTTAGVNSRSKVVNLNSNGNTSATQVQPFGGGGPRIEIIVGAQGEIFQCQLGRVNCVLLVRKGGTRGKK